MVEQKKPAAIVEYDEATFAEAAAVVLNKKQFNNIMKKTPAKYLHERPAKGGGKWTYVTGGYVKKVLNVVFGWNWDFQVIKYEFDLGIGQAFVHGRLTCRSGQHTIIKEQFGRVDIKFKTKWENNQKITTDEPLDLGNDLKAASTDALKKCASELGICADVYAAEDWNEVRAIDDADFDGAVTPEVQQKINSFKTPKELTEWAMLKENRTLARSQDFQDAVKNKLEELWQEQ